MVPGDIVQRPRDGDSGSFTVHASNLYAELGEFLHRVVVVGRETRLSGAGRLSSGLVPPSLVLSCEIGRHFQGMPGSQSFVGW